MANQPILHINPRHSTGTHTSRRARRSGHIPGVLYGHGEPESIEIDVHEFRQAIKPAQYGSQVVQLRLNGNAVATALVKAVQINPLGQQILNIDLQRVSMDERVPVQVSVILEGEPAGTRGGGVLEQIIHAVMLRCRADAVPTALHLDVSAMQIGDALHGTDLVLPTQAELLDKSDEVIVILAAPRTAPAEADETPVPEGVSGPVLTGQKQKDDFPSEQ